MTSPLGIIGLTYDTDDLQLSDLTLFLTITYGLNEPAEPRGRDVLVPYLNGQVARPRRPDTRRILLAGHVKGDGADTAARQSAYRAMVRYLNDLFSPARMPADLVASLEDGSTATLAARPLPMVFTERVPSEWADLTVELLSIDPDWVYDEAGS